MPSISSSVRSVGGIAATHELLSAGHTPAGIFAAVRVGEILRIRKGWYCNTGVGADVLQAWRVGGQLACVSAARNYGLWVPDIPEFIHISVTPNAAQLRSPTDHHQRLATAQNDSTRIHWTRRPSGDRTSVSVPTAIDQIFHCQPTEVAFVVLESALHLGRLSRVEYLALLERLPARARPSADVATAHSESGAESLLKLLLLRCGIPFRQQVVYEGVGRVDFVIGQHLVIEVDSRQHHSDPYKDRRRDAALSVHGSRVLRFMYSQIVYEIDQVEAAIVSALARSDHNRA